MFAYLPLRSYGFRFIIQGDFEVPSSREDVDSDKSWNQWLREEIPQLFIDALSVFMVGKIKFKSLLIKQLLPQYSHSRYRTGTSLQLRLNLSLFKCKWNLFPFNDIPPHEPPFHASSSPIPRLQILSI